MRAVLRALSGERWTTAAFAVAAFATTLLQSLAFYRMAGRTFGEHSAFGYSLTLDAEGQAALFPPPLHPETVTGYLALRAFAPLAILFAAWATVSATRPPRQPTSVSAATFALSVTTASAAACLGAIVGISAGDESVSAPGLAEAGILLVALATACYAIGAVVAQITRAATVVAGLVMPALFFLNSTSRIFSQLATMRWLSPFRYYEVSTPLPPGGRFDLGGFAMLVAVSILGVVAAALIARRPHAVASPQLKTFAPAHMRVLAIPVVRILYPMRVALAAWCIAFAGLGFVMVLADHTSMQGLLAFPRGLPGVTQYVFVFYAQLLDVTWFEVAIAMLATLAFAFVVRWADEDRDGCLEAVLSAPYSRPMLVLERVVGLGVAAAVLIVLTSLSVAITSGAMTLGLDLTRLAATGAVLVLFSVVLGAVGSLLTSWVPRAAPALFGLFVLAAFLDDQIGGALRLPLWAHEISPFRLAADPLVHGVDGGKVALLLVFTLAAAGSSILALQRHDVRAHSPTKSSQALT